MATDRMVIPGVVKNGLIVPQGPAPLPEGAQVEIVIPVLELPPDVRAEFDAWERAGDEAWALIDPWEREEQVLSHAQRHRSGSAHCVTDRTISGPPRGLSRR